MFLERYVGSGEEERKKVGLGWTPWCAKQHDQELCVIICLRDKRRPTQQEWRRTFIGNSKSQLAFGGKWGPWRVLQNVL